MSARIAKLEGLLARVQARAAEPRPVKAAAAAAEEAAVEEVAPEEAPVDEIDELDEVHEIEEVELDEPGAPESGPVATGAPTLDDAMNAAEHQPPMTPPPESGEGVASPQIPADDGPTMEQLGETIALEEGGRQEFELDEPVLDEPTLDEPELDEPGAAQMEADIPSSVPASQEDLVVPENAREELDRVRLGDATPVEARVSSRPVLSTNVVDLASSAREFSPKSFLDLVDASLQLK